MPIWAYLPLRRAPGRSDRRASHRAQPEPGHRWLHARIGEVLLQKGDAEAALAEMQQEADEAVRLIGLSMAYHALGRKAESDAALAELIAKYEKTAAYYIAYVLAYRGEADRAFEWLDKAVEYHDPDPRRDRRRPDVRESSPGPALAAVPAQDSAWPPSSSRRSSST